MVQHIPAPHQHGLDLRDVRRQRVLAHGFGQLALLQQFLRHQRHAHAGRHATDDGLEGAELRHPRRRHVTFREP
jgi:hypothetical protein